MVKKSKKAPTKARGNLSGKYGAMADKARQTRVGSELWAPEDEGDAIAGKLISSSWRDGVNGEYCSIIIDGPEASHLVRLGAVLVRTFHERGIRIGADLGIAYQGTQPSGKGRPTKLYAVHVEENGDGELVVDDERYAEYQQRREAKRKVRKAKGSKAKAAKARGHK